MDLKEIAEFLKTNCTITTIDLKSKQRLADVIHDDVIF